MLDKLSADFEEILRLVKKFPGHPGARSRPSQRVAQPQPSNGRAACFVVLGRV